MKYYHFSGKTALITGATSGIGNCIAGSLHAAGCHLICITSSREGENKLLEQFKGCIVLRCDFRNSEERLNLMRELNAFDNDVDILVNCAGIFPLKNIANSSIEDFEDCFNVNVKSAFILSKYFGTKMCKKRSGRIVNIGSSSSYNGSEDAGIYCASKHALLGLTRSLYKEYKPYGVRVYSISPGSCQTPMGKSDTRQDFTTFITPAEVAVTVMDILKFNSEGIMEEIRINRVVVQ